MTKPSKLFLAAFLLLGISAFADTITFNHTVGDFGTNQSTISGVQIRAYYYKNGSWQAADLFGRNEGTDDIGVGVCDPAEKANCGTGTGGGDYNELSDELYPEIIRIKLPVGYTWNSVGLSSLDADDGSDERGVLYSSSSGTPGAPGHIGTQICTFAAVGVQSCASSGGENPNITIGTQYANSQYLFLEARDWNMPSNTNNDFLLRAVTITHVAVPEPGTLLLLGSGLVGLTAPIRRRFKK